MKIFIQIKAEVVEKYHVIAGFFYFFLFLNRSCLLLIQAEAESFEIDLLCGFWGSRELESVLCVCFRFWLVISNWKFCVV